MKAILGLAALLFSFTASADSYVGFGFAIEKKNASSPVTIIDIVEKSPAERAGIQKGEILNAVNGTVVKNQSIDDVSKILKGNEGEWATLELQNGSDGPTRDVKLQREVINVECFLEGSISLRFNLAPDGTGWLSGWVGQDHIRLNVMGERVYGMVKSDYVSMTYQSSGDPDDHSTRVEVRGFVKNTYVTWRGWGNYISGFQSCIR